MMGVPKGIKFGSLIREKDINDSSKSLGISIDSLMVRLRNFDYYNKYRKNIKPYQHIFFDYPDKLEWDKNYDDKFKQYDRKELDTIGKCPFSPLANYAE